MLETDRLRLEPLTLDHVDLLVDLDRDPEVMRFISGGKASTRDEVASVVRAHVGYRWAALTKDDGEFFGWFGMRPADAAHEYVLGYRLRRSFWGRGLATEGARHLIDLAFTRLGAQRVVADTMTVNERSRRVMERCGLTYVRTFHLEWDEPIAGTELGDVEYAVTRGDYERRRPSSL